jgi:hypothetical protein
MFCCCGRPPIASEEITEAELKLAEERKKIVNDFKIRDSLLRSNGYVTYSYCVKKALGMGIERQRELVLDFEHLSIIFPDSRRVKSSYPIESIVSLSPTDIPGKVLLFQLISIMD